MQHFLRYSLTTVVLVTLFSREAFTQDSTSTTLPSSIEFLGDFRFRAEQDWNVRRPDGTYYDDRTRFRIRARFGFIYHIDEKMHVKGQIRTGYLNNPQDPQITLGSSDVAFDNMPILLDYAVFHYGGKRAWFSLGKDKWPFLKYTELFWSDNVNPQGIASGVHIRKDKKFKIDLNAGYFVGFSKGGNLGDDAFLVGGQTIFKNEGEHCELTVPIGFFAFQNFPLYPGKDSELLDRNILQPTVSWRSKKMPVEVAFETYFNLSEANVSDSILQDFSQETFGWDIMVAYGSTDKKGDYMIKVTYAILQQHSIVDYFAQNDWARWDYGFIDSNAGRLTNFKGAEVVLGWRWHKNAKLIMKYYPMQQLKAYGPALETNQRLRLDLDVQF